MACNRDQTGQSQKATQPDSSSGGGLQTRPRFRCQHFAFVTHGHRTAEMMPEHAWSRYAFIC
jgi:hypothetical protein